MLVVALLSRGEGQDGTDGGNAGSIVDITSDENRYIPRDKGSADIRMELAVPGEKALASEDIYRKMGAVYRDGAGNGFQRGIPPWVPACC